MVQDALKKDITAVLGSSASFEDSIDHLSLSVDKNHLLQLMEFLKTRFDFLMNVSGVDCIEFKRPKRFEIVYELFSTKDYQRVRVKVPLGENETIMSLTGLWKGANWFEREIYDMFGITFERHPYLKRILCHHEFEGHPLRKDYPADRQQHCNTPLDFHFEDEASTPENHVLLNIGPSHPATHGTLRIMCELNGEKIHRANVEIGYLHRCFEKMAETHPYNQVIPYTDRLNYCSSPMNNVGYCHAVEQLLKVEIPPKAQALRVILCELSRIIDHIVCIGAAAVDLGALTGFFHLFAYREMVYTLFEKLCGARLTVSLTRVGGMAQDPPRNWIHDVLDTCREIKKGIDEMEGLLTENKIWIQRNKGIGKITAEEAIEWGWTGPLLRACGVGLDLRAVGPSYYGYDQLDFEIPVGSEGDCYERYLVRVEEMKQSVKIIEQVARNLPSGDYTIRDKDITLPEKKDVYGNIEGLMNHFVLVMNGLRPAQGDVYSATEAANGELGFYLISDGSAQPYRLKVRPPCFAIYQAFPEQIRGTLVSDVVAILGSMNIVAGELDR